MLFKTIKKVRENVHENARHTTNNGAAVIAR